MSHLLVLMLPTESESKTYSPLNQKQFQKLSEITILFNITTDHKLSRVFTRPRDQTPYANAVSLYIEKLNFRISNTLPAGV